jgi:hypothetical protein
VVSLAGTWRFATDSGDEGIANGWWRSAEALTENLPLPGTTDLAGKGERRTNAPDGEHHLTREFHHLGPAWYQRDIEIPKSWRGLRVELTLERVMWQSRVWLDDREVSPPGDSLSVPHIHSLGHVGTEIAPGTRRLTLRIDNRMIHPIGDKGHAYGDQMQSIWNGAVGEIALRTIAPGEVRHARIFPDAETQTIRAELTLEPGTSHHSPTGTIILHDPDGREITRALWQTEPGTTIHETTLKLETPPRLWSEFEQPLYQVDVRSDRAGEGSEPWSERFGFRSIGRAGQRLAINGRPTFFRGNLECAAFPLTGHPPVDVESWRRIWRVYREHNLNHARFHSWCPPRAAFEAADELGIYLQVEAPIWMDHWMAGPNPRPEMETAGHPQGLGKNDRGNDDFARAEIRRILDEYGNHPSFVLFCIGNELGTSDFDVIGRWMAEARAHDPRRLYAASTARTITGHCDYNATHHIPGIGPCRARFSADTRWNYEETYARAPVPILAHETGQVPVYPDWNELAKFTGPLKPFRLEAMREQARANGILNDAADLRAASGALNRLLNREELEGYFRTPSCAGFQLLSMQDFTGQGEALVGWRDIFYQDKGTTDPAEFRQWCAPTVPLLEIPKRIWQTHETLTAATLIHHSGPEPETHISLHWSLRKRDGPQTLASGTLPAVTVKPGDVARAGELSIDLKHITAPAELQLTLAAEGRNEICNSYPLWIFPEKIDSSAPDDIVLTDDWPAAKAAIAAGRRVVFFTDRVGAPGATGLASWRPLYWSVPFFPGQHSQTLGLLVRNDHPALATFPTPAFNDWLWHDICAGAKGFDLTGLVPDAWKPITQPVTDFHLNRKLGSLFELRVGQGSLLVSGYSLAADRAATHPEVAALRRSLLDYAASPAFAPTLELPVETLDALFPEPPPELAALPEGFAGAQLYIRAAGRLAERNQNRPHNPADDQVLARAEGIKYTVEADGAWRDDSGSAWHGKQIRITLETRAGVPGTLHLRFHDWNRNGRTGTLTIEGETLDLPAHTEARWILFPILREHTNDGRILIHATATAGPNLMLTDLAFLPTE